MCVCYTYVSKVYKENYYLTMSKLMAFNALGRFIVTNPLLLISSNNTVSVAVQKPLLGKIDKVGMYCFVVEKTCLETATLRMFY